MFDRSFPMQFAWEGKDCIRVPVVAILLEHRFNHTFVFNDNDFEYNLQILTLQFLNVLRSPLLLWVSKIGKKFASESTGYKESSKVIIIL